MNRYLAAAALSSLLVPSRAFAQEAPPQATPAPSPSAAPKAGKTESDFTLGLAWQGPTRLTGSATLMWGHPKMLVAWSPAKLIQVRAGDRGGQVGIGLVAGVFEENPFKPSGIAITFKAIALHTWRDPDATKNGNTYVGPESDIVLLGIRGSVGYAWKVAGSGGSGGRFVWSIGFGL
jgi:hypothetical protein